MARVVVVASLLACVAALAASLATGKSWPVARACGDTKCILGHHPAVDTFFEWWSVGFHDLAVPVPARYYSIRWHDDTFDVNYVLLYVPSRHVMSIWQSRVPPYTQSMGPYWRAVPRREWRPLSRILSKLAPHRPPAHWPKPPIRS